MSVIDNYLTKVKSPQKEVLERVRTIIQAAAPEATESISYGMPAFKYNAKYLIGFAPFKDHLSIFPGSNAVAVLHKQLSGYKTAKGTIQFTIEKPLPEKLIQEIIALRIADIEHAT